MKTALLGLASLCTSAMSYYVAVLILLWRRATGFPWPGPDAGFPLIIAGVPAMLAWLVSRHIASPQIRESLGLTVVSLHAASIAWLFGYAAAKAAGLPA